MDGWEKIQGEELTRRYLKKKTGMGWLSNRLRPQNKTVQNPSDQMWKI